MSCVKDQSLTVVDTLVSFYLAEVPTSSPFEKVIYPAPIFGEFPSDESMITDSGTMYKVVDTKLPNANEKLTQWIENTTPDCKSAHVFWGIL